MHNALIHTGNGYVLHSLHPTITNVLLKERSLQLSVLCQGDLIYHFSSQDLTTLRQQLTGKSRQQGIAMLSHLNGVDHVTFQFEKNATFPTDPTHIHIVFVVVS